VDRIDDALWGRPLPASVWSPRRPRVGGNLVLGKGAHDGGNPEIAGLGLLALAAPLELLPALFENPEEMSPELAKESHGELAQRRAGAGVAPIRKEHAVLLREGNHSGGAKGPERSLRPIVTGPVPVLLIDRLHDAKRKAGELCESGDAEKAPPWVLDFHRHPVRAGDHHEQGADDRLHSVRSTPLEVGTSVDGWLTIARLPAWSLEQLGNGRQEEPAAPIGERLSQGGPAIEEAHESPHALLHDRIAMPRRDWRHQEGLGSDRARSRVVAVAIEGWKALGETLVVNNGSGVLAEAGTWLSRTNAPMSPLLLGAYTAPIGHDCERIAAVLAEGARPQ